MTDEEIIKKRLLIDGDGTGDDRRLNMLIKQFLKWTNSKCDTPENNQIMYDRLLAQLAQCQFVASKSEFISQMINEELKNYTKLSEQIEKSTDIARTEIVDSKEQLLLAREIRKNKMEYDLLARIIKEQPDRKDTQKQIDNLQKELTELLDKKVKLERKFHKRRNDFTLLMYSIRELQSQLDNDSSSDESNELDIMDVSDDEIALNDKSDLKKSPSQNDAIKKPQIEEDSVKESNSIDDAVLELTIDNDVKMEENVSSVVM